MWLGYRDPSLSGFALWGPHWCHQPDPHPPVGYTDDYVIAMGEQNSVWEFVDLCADKQGIFHRRFDLAFFKE